MGALSARNALCSSLLLLALAALACGNREGAPTSTAATGSSTSATGAASGETTSGQTGGTTSGATSGATSGTTSETSAGTSAAASSGTSSGAVTSTSSTSGAALVAVPLTGCASIGYSAPVTIGSQTFALSLDTGSTDLGVAQASCSDCGVSPEYTPLSGSCSGMTSSNYGSGSQSGGGWTAQICSADVQVGPEMPAVSMKLAGITAQSQFFISYDCPGTLNQGIIGLGPLDLDTIGTASTDAYFPALVQQAGVPDVVALLLCSTKGLLWFGGYDPTYASGPPQFTPMSASASWTIDLLGIGLGTQSLGGADPQSLVDTGTWGFYMASSAYAALVTAVANDPGATAIFGAGTLDATFFSTTYFGGDCASPTAGQTQAEIDAALPPLTLTLPALDGGTFALSLPATQSYLAPLPVNGVVQYCSGVADSHPIGDVTILGNSVLQAYITILDEGGRQVGFAPQSFCP